MMVLSRLFGLGEKEVVADILNGHGSRDEAIVVSFAAGDDYYHQAANVLRSDLSRLGIQSDIQNIDIPDGLDWIDVCRKKIRYYLDMLHKHKRPIVWVDVDTKVVKKPVELLNSTADVSGFLRNFKDLVGFDPAQHSRLLAPAILGFGYNPRVLKFLGKAADLAEKSDIRATDDYFLQEAISAWGKDLRFMLLRSSDVGRGGSSKDTFFVHGHSGNVGSFIGEAQQHEISALEIGRQKRVLLDSAEASLKKGDRAAAMVFYRRVRQLDPEDRIAMAGYLEGLRISKEWGKFDYHVNKNRTHPELGDLIEKAEFLAAADREDWKRVDKIHARAIERQSPNLGFIKSRFVRVDLDRRAAALNVSDDDRVKMWWMETPYPGNFGDIINPYLIEALSGVPPKFTHKNPRLLAVGSIIKFAKRNTDVWGSGCPSRDQILSADAKYHAVRGPLTREMVLDAGGKAPEVYGDPAWFLPKIYNPKIRKTHKLGMILHSVHRDAVANIDPDVKMIDITRVGPSEIEAFIDELLSCEAVLSTSLHGVIVAHAYNIPVRWCVATGSSKQIHGDGLKFEDYFQSVGRPAPVPLDLSSIERVSVGSVKEFDHPNTGIDLSRLAEAAPFKVVLRY